MGDHTLAAPGVALVWLSMGKIWVSDLISSKIAMVSNPPNFGVDLINRGLTNTVFYFFKHQRTTVAFKVMLSHNILFLQVSCVVGRTDSLQNKRCRICSAN